MRTVVVEFGAADSAWVTVVAGIGPPYSDLCFDSPMFAENPVVAICNACSGKPALGTRVFEHGEIGAKKREGEIDFGDVVLAAEYVQAEEMAGELVTEPATYFRHHNPVAPLLLVGKLPEIEVSGELCCPKMSHTRLDSEVGVCCSVVYEIGFYSRLLSIDMSGRGHEAQQSYQGVKYFHDISVDIGLRRFDRQPWGKSANGWLEYVTN